MINGVAPKEITMCRRTVRKAILDKAAACKVILKQWLENKWPRHGLLGNLRADPQKEEEEVQNPVGVVK